MNTSTPQRAASRPIKGSWEELHERAQKHALNYNDEAIPLYRRIFERLMKLPPAARAVGDSRLYNLMMTAGVEFQGYLNLRDRYDESLAVIDQMLGVVTELDKPQIIELKSDVLLQADRGDEAIAVLRQLIDSEDVDAGDWGHMVAAYLRMKQPEKALATVDELVQWIESKSADGTIEGQEITDARYYPERLRAAVLLELGRIDEVIALFNEVHAQGGEQAISPHLIYPRLIHEDHLDESLRLVNRDQARPVRAAFWRGLIYYYKDEEARARRIWQDALGEESLRADQGSIVEHILTHYYLGDTKGTGLETVLRAQREQARLSWIVFLLTGLGWIMRGDSRAAHSNMRLAISQVKSMGDGKKLAYQYWRFVLDLAPEGKAAEYEQYFETEPTGRSAQSQIGADPTKTSESPATGSEE